MTRPITTDTTTPDAERADNPPAAPIIPPSRWPRPPAGDHHFRSVLPLALLSPEAIAALYAGSRYEDFSGREFLDNTMPPRDPAAHLQNGDVDASYSFGAQAKARTP